MPGDPGETRLALTFSLNRADRADRTTPRSNVSVTNETVAARRLFPLRQINFDTRDKASWSSTYAAGDRRRWANQRRTAQYDPPSPGTPARRSDTSHDGSALLEAIDPRGSRRGPSLKAVLIVSIFIEDQCCLCFGSSRKRDGPDALPSH